MTTATIALKTLHNDIVKADPSFTKTPKQMRVVLREKFADIHDRNSSWTFTPAQYDKVRAHFDPKYAAKLTRNAKPKAPRKSRKIADNATGNEALVINNETHTA